jgi:uncharacterized protein YjiS (DUF1127 family)
MISTALHCLEAPPSSGRGSFVLAVIAVVLAFILVWRERRRGRRELAVMSERELLDIGIYRSDIANEIDKPFWRSFTAADAVR